MIVKRITMAILVTFGLSFAGIASALDNQSLMVINNSKFPVSINYTQCHTDNKGTICTMDSPVTIDIAPNQNYLGIIPKFRDSEVLSVVSAEEKDQFGNVTAKLNNQCSMPDGASVVILNDYGTPQIICQYASTREMVKK